MKPHGQSTDVNCYCICFASLDHQFRRFRYFLREKVLREKKIQWNSIKSEMSFEETSRLNNIKEIIEAVSSMEEINISMVKNLSVDEQFVNKCKSLKKLSFRADDDSILDHLNAKLQVEWHVMIEKLNEWQVMGEKLKMFDIAIVRQHT